MEDSGPGWSGLRQWVREGGKHEFACVNVRQRVCMQREDCGGNCQGRAMCTKDGEAY